jgi:hypothetical protein
LTSNVVTEQDAKEFAQLLADVYEMGFLRATNQYREHLEKMGYKLSIVPEKKV